MIEKLKSRWILFGGPLVLLTVLLSAGCVQVAPAALQKLTGGNADSSSDTPAVQPVAIATNIALPDSQTATGSTTASTGAATLNVPVTGRKPVAVRRGTIAETQQLSGRVAGAEDTPLSFSITSHVDTVQVKQGDTVQKDQILVTAESQSIEKDLAAAQARTDADAIRVQQAQAQADARQRDSSMKSQIDQAKGASSVADAEANLRQAQADAAKIMAGASDADRRVAQSAVIAAQLTLQAAQADQARLQAGPDPDLLRRAQTDLATAQSGLTKAQADLDRTKAGADPYDVRAAERDVQEAQDALNAAEAARKDRIDPKDDPVRVARERDQAVAGAQRHLADMEDRLARLKQPANSSTVSVAQHAVDVAQLAVDAANAHLQEVKKGADDLTLGKADAAVQNAQNAVDAAQAKLDELTSHPTPDEARQAQAKVQAAQAAVNRARLENQPTVDTSGGAGSFDILLLQKNVEQDQAQVAALQKELEDTRLRAPFDGVITSVSVRVTDPITPARPVAVIAKTGAPVVRADLTESDSNVTSGQKASIQLDSSSAPMNGSVIAIATATNSSARYALIQVDWTTPPPPFGTTTQVQVVLHQKENTLLIPKNAVRSAGTRHYVETMDGANRKVANVEVGITSGDVTEIVSGLQEGQLVLVGP